MPGISKKRVQKCREWIVICLVAALLSGTVRAADLTAATKLFKTGKYAETINAAMAAIRVDPWDEDAWVLMVRAELASGKYTDAQQTYQAGLNQNPQSIALRLAGYDVLRANGRPEDANVALTMVRAAVVRDPQRYGDPKNRVIIGRALELAGADARQVLELFYDPAKRASTTAVEPYIASGQLALEKEDFQLAAEAFAEAAKRDPDDPDIQLNLARAFQNDSDRATAALNKALELNPNHVDSLLFQADNLIDREAYDQAEEILKTVLSINPNEPRAWAYRAILAHLSGDRAGEESARNQALQIWKTNPEVDSLIGQKLAQKYRFAEGAAYQRQALKMVPNYRPAKLELCNALLRLGQEAEGWSLADEIFKEDQYNVLAYNLVTLHDTINKFKTVQNEHFLVRMDAREAEIYGQRVLDLLEQARTGLSAKYDVQLNQPITVEIFPQQKDFAIRTFGMPGGAGYLGVCFGSVVTVNSPATRGANPVNWQAVVWHEFCHVITLNKTKNKMPRWLSEGISVYEEMQRDPSWGQTMNPQYREFVRTGIATPVSKLSSAFMQPPSPMHLQFAYYESAMVVEYVVDKFGIESLKKILTDLGNDVPINQALAKYTVPIEKLDSGFADWLKEKSEQLAPKADLARPETDLDADSTATAAWNKDHPNNFWGLLSEGRALLTEGKSEAAKIPLQKAIELYPNYAGPGGPYLLLAQADRQLDQTDAEQEMLTRHISLSSDSVEPRLRLLEILAKKEDWNSVQQYAEQVLAINPLIPAPHRYLLQAAEARKNIGLAIDSQRIVLMMDPLNVADQHYHLARLLLEDQKLPEARREVVLSLEQAPRFLAAHKLLLEIVDKMNAAAAVNAPATQQGNAP